jgi:hypothetical protein
MDTPERSNDTDMVPLPDVSGCDEE